MSEEFPAEDVLIARGKYSTVASEKRDGLRELRDLCESISGCASRVIRMPNDMVFMTEQAAALGSLAQRALSKVAEIQVLQEHLNQLKPIAWGGKAVEHEQ